MRIAAKDEPVGSDTKTFAGQPLSARLLRGALFVMPACLLVLAVSARAGSDAPAVWVPLAPAGGQAEGPVVLVPYAQSLRLAEPGNAPSPWMPDYLSSGADPGVTHHRLRNMPRRDDFDLVGAGLTGSEPAGGGLSGERLDAGDAGAAREAPGLSVSLSDLLRDAQWRRETAARLRARPGLQPRF